MNVISRAGLIAVLFFILVRCNQSPKTLFELRSSGDTDIHFANTIQETDSFNILTYEYIYNGGGVGVADFNNDGLSDVFFTGNEVGNKLYINEGGFDFEDVTDQASVNVPGRWNSGVAIADVNSDGWNDIYVCATMKRNPADRRNMLFVNQGANAEGIPTFKEMAESYGVADQGYSVTAAFFDYDRDGDLDLYVLTNEKLNNLPTNFRPKIIDGSSPNNDRLYRNNGDDTFTNVTIQSGITIEGFGLGLAVADFNADGWPDIYVSNDYLSNDVLYMNNGDGTFKNRISELIGHQSLFSMGNDAADINNDALPDIVTLDMLPEINRRKKTTISNKSYQTYVNTEKFGYEYQYVRNMLHINNGADKGIKFSEVGQLAGIYQTEWSWSSLMADFDNDGDKDLLITNGFPKDVTDKDFANYRADLGNVAGIRYLVDSIPVVKIPNYGYMNNGDLTFKDMTAPWGLYRPSFSNGAAFADLDNDGDLDYVVNNINDEAFIYENKMYYPGQPAAARNNFIRFRLEGEGKNKHAIGAKITLRYGGKLQFSEQSVYRGFLSSVEPIVHFGLGTATSIDSVLIVWPDGQTQLLTQVKANQVLDVKKSEAGPTTNTPIKSDNPLFEDANSKTRISFKHSEQDVIDYNFQRTVPHKFSQSGPGICVGDINGDGLEDFVVGGSAGYSGTIFQQNRDGSFTADAKRLKGEGKLEEDEGLLLFDADNDTDLDLYAVSGSIEPGKSLDIFEDRLYINNGRGQFTINKSALPPTKASGSCVRAADYDGDGDLDLFVGGRVIPGSYPYSPESYLLRNDGGKFTNVTYESCTDLKLAGMITDALWTDLSGDGKVDLLVVGEFMAVTAFRNEGNGRFSKLTATGLEDKKGWWNSIAPGDFDSDGDMDYVVGNLGKNNNYQVSEKFPLVIYANDIDGNGSVDPVLFCYQKETLDLETRKLYPIHFWDELNSQSPKFRKRFASYKHYGRAGVNEVLAPEELDGAVMLSANFMASGFIENKGGGKFTLSELPNEVQVAPVNGMVTGDYNGDGMLDVLMVGNDYGNEVFAGRYDAFTGIVLLGDGKGGFRALPSAKSGYDVGGDAKGLARISGVRDVWIATQNRDSLKVFSQKEDYKYLNISPLKTEFAADVTYESGRKQRFEFYYGSGYLSQSSRSIRMSDAVKEIILHDFGGGTRTITPRKN